MPYLPNEVWLLVLPYCNRRDAWLGLRPLSRQLQACVELYFAEFVLPTVKLHLELAVPSYDVRQRLQGRAVFAYRPSKKVDAEGESSATSEAPIVANDERAHWRLIRTEPDEQYRAHILARWESMAHASAHSLLPGSLDERLTWKAPLSGNRSVEVRLPRGQIEWDSYGGNSEQAAQLSCEWRPLMTGLFRRLNSADEVGYGTLGFRVE
ncbi:hypothetical protein LTR53_017830 [Teratosphaeriaceae sp. CCFEE 6253]|nr:hypothetical protein LTR53_017830 [Teratosphaeriaceae sp. CCFEE 6253]